MFVCHKLINCFRLHFGCKYSKKIRTNKFFCGKNKKAAGFWLAASLYAPMHDVAPSAVSIADAIEAIN
jgi:hypothetical protein